MFMYKLNFTLAITIRLSVIFGGYKPMTLKGKEVIGINNLNCVDEFGILWYSRKWDFKTFSTLGLAGNWEILTFLKNSNLVDYCRIINKSSSWSVKKSGFNRGGPISKLPAVGIEVVSWLN